MKLKEGKVYLRRDGFLTGPLQLTLVCGGTYLFEDLKHSNLYATNLRISKNKSHPADLILQIPKKFIKKLEANEKAYKHILAKEGNL